eukprot:Gb_29418 [translate_table: standard]
MVVDDRSRWPVRLLRADEGHGGGVEAPGEGSRGTGWERGAPGPIWAPNEDAGGQGKTSGQTKVWRPMGEPRVKKKATGGGVGSLNPVEVKGEWPQQEQRRKISAKWFGRNYDALRVKSISEWLCGLKSQQRGHPTVIHTVERLP